MSDIDPGRGSAVVIRCAAVAARLYGWLLGAVIAAGVRVLGLRARPSGPASTIGVIIGVHVLVLMAWTGPASVVLAIVVALASSREARRRIRHRGLDEAEFAMARCVFGADAHWLERVAITDLAGRNGRAFTVPGVDGRVYCNLGARFDHLDSWAARRLLIHELTHALQIERAASSAHFLAEAMALQARYDLGDDVYALDADTTWETANLEQQATLMERRTPNP